MKNSFSRWIAKLTIAKKKKDLSENACSLIGNCDLADQQTSSTDCSVNTNLHDQNSIPV